jgi:3-hydroxyisobutyrate dehydrogenase-like beta-hydroxyacid dehydrogenase
MKLVNQLLCGVRIAAAAEAGAPVPLSAAARELYQRGHDQGRGRQDDSALIEVLRHR